MFNAMTTLFMINLNFYISNIYYIYFYDEKFFFFFFYKFSIVYRKLYLLIILILIYIYIYKNYMFSQLILIFFLCLCIYNLKHYIFLNKFYRIFYNFNIYNNIVFSHTFFVTLIMQVLWYLYKPKSLLVFKEFNNFNSNYIFFFFIVIILGSVWSSQEVLWNGYWNWDLVEKSILFFFIHILIYVHILQKKEIKFVLENYSFFIFYCILILSTKNEFSNSVHSFTSNFYSQIGFYFLVIFVITFSYIKVYFFKNLKIFYTFFLTFFFFTNALLIYFDLPFFFCFEYFIYFLLYFSFFKVINFIWIFFIFEYDFLYFLFFNIFFFKKKKNLFNHILFYTLIYIYFIFFYRDIMNLTYIIENNYHIIYNMIIIENIFKLVEFDMSYNNIYLLNVLFKSILFSNIVKFYIIFFKNFLYFYIFYNSANNLVYFFPLKLNFFFIIFFFCRIKKKYL